MRIKVRILIDFESDAEARAVYSSLEPDNTNLPKGLDMEMSIVKRLLTIDFSSIGKLETLISTIDDLLLCSQASIDTLDEIETIR